MPNRDHMMGWLPAAEQAPKKRDYSLLVNETDAQVWAEAFHDRFPGVPAEDVLGWFACAVEAGRDAGLAAGRLVDGTDTPQRAEL